MATTSPLSELLRRLLFQDYSSRRIWRLPLSTQCGHTNLATLSFSQTNFQNKISIQNLALWLVPANAESRSEWQMVWSAYGRLQCLMAIQFVHSLNSIHWIAYFIESTPSIWSSVLSDLVYLINGERRVRTADHRPDDHRQLATTNRFAWSQSVKRWNSRAHTSAETKSALHSP